MMNSSPLYPVKSRSLRVMELKFYGELSLSLRPSKTTFKEAHLSADLRSHFISAIFTSSLCCSYQNFAQKHVRSTMCVVFICYRCATSQVPQSTCFQVRRGPCLCATHSAVHWLQCNCCSATPCYVVVQQLQLQHALVKAIVDS